MKRFALTGGVLLLILVLIVIAFEESREFIVALMLRTILFVKKNILAMLAAFFLVKGKFVLTLFLKKLAILSASGLGKRYVVEKVVMGNVKKHFLDYLVDDIKRLVQFATKNFKNFTVVKKLLSIFAFLSSLSVVGKFMGGMLAVKVFVAKVWSFLLAVFLKVSTAVAYFFTDYLWGSWLAPIIEVVIFTWLLEWMEKVPYLSKWLKKIYTFFRRLFGWIEYYIEKVFHIPLKSFLKWLVRKIQEQIYVLIGYKKGSKWQQLKEQRVLTPNAHQKLMVKRVLRKEKNIKPKIRRKDSILAKRKKKS